jgi:ATP-dependent DNA ligase
MAPEVMLCRLSHDLPAEQGWVLEPKWDGFRFIYSIGRDRVQAHTRNRHPHAGRFPYLE